MKIEQYFTAETQRFRRETIEHLRDSPRSLCVSAVKNCNGQLELIGQK